MKALFYAAHEIREFFKTNKWKFCFIGGIALQRWGEPRLTQDIDVSLLTRGKNENDYVEPLLRKYEGRIQDAKEFALRNRTLLLVSSQGIGIDIALACLPFEEAVIGRSSGYEFLPGLQLETCSAEDLIIMKSFANRTRDWADVEGILIRQEDRLDWPYIEGNLLPLCELKEAPEIVTRLKALKDNTSSS